MSLIRKCKQLILFFGLSLITLVHAQVPIAGGAPIKLIVPFTPGTGIDMIARTVAPKLAEKLGQPVIVDNRTGASGNIGTEAVVRAKPDGATLLVTVNTIVMNRALYPKLGFDPVNDLTPISLAAWGELVFVVPESSPYKSASQFIEAAKTKPGKLTYASPGVGTPHHLAMELLKNVTNISVLHIPYKGTGPAVTDLLGAQVDAMFLPIHVAMTYIKSGKLRALAIGSSKRHPSAPQIATFKELKIGQIDVDMWYGFMAPKGLNGDDLNKIANALHQILQEPDIKNIFATQGLDPAVSSSQVFKALIDKDAKRWERLIKSQGIVAD